MRALIVAGAVAVLAMAVMLFFVIADEPDSGELLASEPVSADRAERPGSGKKRRVKPRRPRPDAGVLDKSERKEGPVGEETVKSFGQEFERKWYEDRKKLGLERHQEMEQLWFGGRRPRGSEEAIGKLQKIVDEFGDTNRAGCAAMELGHHYIRKPGLSVDERRKKAQAYWHLAESRYKDGLCEYNSPTAGMSKLALASWVYRYTDPAMARRLLQELIEEHQGETDHLGQPLSKSAQRLLGSIK